MMKRCAECGSSSLKMVDVKGRAFPWRDYPAIHLFVDYEAVECQSCHELLFRGSDLKAFDEAIAASITLQVKVFTQIIVDREKCEQSDLARNHLGVSPEYLSEIKSGRKLPKFQLFNFLKTLAVDPDSYKKSDASYLSETAIRKISA